ncbi:hypothetical protein KC370_12475 [Listeria monocytogenes]|uniref:hypothetical protein n=1 Tax=Listeria monocytogenes TaxID=1639 RepID=UPI0015E11ED8|nr:hypothetical protein [Listeria monocytogenes]
MIVCVVGALYWKDYMLVFARMHIWAVTRYTSNGRMGMRISDRWWMDFGGG